MDNSSSEDTSSDYSTESSEDDGMETAQIHDTKIQLPQGLCERQDIFREIFSTETWNSLSEVNRQHLQTLLPNFPENDEEEKTKTLQRLFDFETFRFNSPLVKFHDDLKAGFFRPDIARMRQIINKAEQKEAKYRYKTFREQLAHEVIESQNRLLTQFQNLPPGVEPKQEKRKLNVDYVSHRTKRKYFQILSSIKAKTEDNGCSSDENYPDGPPVSLSRKQKRHLNSIRNNLNNSKDKYFSSTMAAKLTGFSLDLEKYITPHHNPFYINDESYRNLIHQHKKRKLENPNNAELNTKGITMNGIIRRTQLPYNKNLPIITKHSTDNNRVVSRKKIKREHTTSRSPEIVNSSSIINRIKHNALFEHSSNSDSDSDSIIDAVSISSTKTKFKTVKQRIIRRTPTPKAAVAVKVEQKKEPPSPQEPFTPTATVTLPVDNSKPPNTTIISSSNTNSYFGKITPVRVEDLDGIDVMNIPIDLENSDIDILELNNKPELMQDTHANFFSLIRDVICSTSEHRMNMYTLQERLKSWQENPISPLNDWYNYTDNWISILPSAITFLCGNASEQPDDFVPYMEYKTNLDVYQWIGAGRDSDTLLSAICSFWLEHRMDGKQSSSLSPYKDGEIEIDVLDRANTPPPPRFPTTWTVRKATPEEIKDFREQERRRYDNPHKAFTYRCNNYESVVGPLKGIYNPAVGNAKARGHTMLSADRPNFVTILSLVRDAAARLPNGEGTRAEICELLKSSQYISSSAPDNILQSVVSGALDRMHTQWDPCVKYDPKKKIWIYLHRNRTEEDFERIHQQYQGITKSKKNITKKSPAKPKARPTSDKVIKTKDPVPSTSGAQIQESSVCKPPIRRPSLQQISKSLPSNTSTQSVPPNLVTVMATSKTASLLLSNNLPKQPAQEATATNIENSQQTATLITTTSNEKISSDDKEVNDAIQAFMQNRVSSPTIKAGKSLVKILSPSQGKSLIIPTTNPHIFKQIQERSASSSSSTSSSSSKHISQVVTQQLLQTLAAQQKHLLAQKQAAASEVSDTVTIKDKLKVPVSVQQQILHSVTPQQLQNIKNVTLLRTQSNQNVNITTAATTNNNQPSPLDQSNIVTVAVSKQDSMAAQPNVHIKTHGNLTPAQQQQILQTIKQKILPNSGMINNQQQIILKQKSGVFQLQKQNANTLTTNQVIGQQKSGSDTLKSIPTTQGPVVAKVLTNAAGQVISVESLLAHQKQHGSLPQGTTLRVAGSKGSQPNIIHLTGTTKQTPITQFTVGSQNSILTLTSQPKLVVASQTSTVTSSVTTTRPTSRTINKTQPNLTKFNMKSGQQLLNAKIVSQSIDTPKMIPSKLVVGGQQNQVKLTGGKNMAFSKHLTLNVAGNANTIRMVNAANLNLTQIGGKPVLLASKGGTIQNLQGQNVLLQAPQNASGATTASLVLQNAVKTSGTQQTTSTNNSINILNQSNLVFSPPVKMQNSQQVVLTSSAAKSNHQGGSGAAGAAAQQNISQGHIVIGSHPVRLQTSNATNAQRVVLASQGQGGQIVAQQILLPAGFQGTAINIKALQGVKVIPLAQSHGSQGKGVQGRQVFARVMNPSLVKQTTTQPTTQPHDKAAAEVVLPSSSE